MRSGGRYVYRFYNEAKQALYIGSTSNLNGRLAAHRAKPWWPSVTRTEINYDASHAEGMAAEQAAIDAERPICNQYRAVGATPIRTFRIDDARWDKVKARAERDDVTVTAVILAALDAYLEDED